MSKNDYDTANIENEFSEGSAFFKGAKKKNLVPPVRTEPPVQTVHPVRIVRIANKREKKHHPFNIFKDQLESLRKLKSRYMMETGEMIGMAEMVREALDTFGRDLLSIDSILLNLSDPLKRWIADINRDPIRLAEEEFGAVDRKAIEEAKQKVQNWISP